MSLKAAFESGEDDATIGAATEPPRWKRIASAVVGGGLVLFGLKNRSLTGSIAAIAGGWLVYREVKGRTRGGPEYDTDVETDMELGGEAKADAESDMDPESDTDTEYDSGTDTDTKPGRSVDPATIATRILEEFDTETPRVERSITIGRSPEELYDLWFEPDTLERIAGPGGEITTVDEDEERWRWTIPGPFEQIVTWETELVEKEPGEYLRWETLEGDLISSEGSVEFRPAPADRGTVATLEMKVDPPGGAVANAVVNQFGIVPKTLESRVLNRFKSLAETGEIPSLETNPSGRGKGDLV